MKLKITLYSVCLLMLLAACQQDGPTPEPSVGSRTVLVYMIAQNSLAPLASADIEEMKEGMRQVDATSGNLLVYIDDYSAPRLIRLGKDKKGKVVEETIENYPEQNSADANVMKKRLYLLPSINIKRRSMAWSSGRTVRDGYLLRQRHVGLVRTAITIWI